MDKKISFWRAVFSEKGEASSKRVLGALCIIAVLFVWSYSSIRFGLGSNETDLAKLIVGVAGLLLGISSITGAFGKPSK